MSNKSKRNINWNHIIGYMYVFISALNLLTLIVGNLLHRLDLWENVLLAVMIIDFLIMACNYFIGGDK